MAGERINIVNEYKLTTGQPLTGSQPFGFTIATDEKTGRKKVIRDPEFEDALRDTIEYFLRHQSRKKALIYLNTKYNAGIAYKALKGLFANTMLYGEYHGNPSYCEAYIDKETFDRIQDITQRNIKLNTGEDRHYIFSGLLLCPECGCKLKGTISSEEKKGKRYKYKRYRCPQHALNHRCSYNKSISENAFERLMIANIEECLEKVKIEALEIADGKKIVIPKYDIDEIHAQIDRLNYSWQTGKIRKVEKYEADYAELLEKLEAAEAERKEEPIKDFSHIEAVLHDGWKAIYENLDDAYKRAFWRAFIKSIEINWSKTIERVNFF